MGNNKSRVTLKTIAETCGYSINTVSRALRNDTKLPPQTVARIHETANELGYIRNRLASSLRSKRSNLIAILADNLHNPHYSTLITQLDTLLHERGYDSFVLCCNGDNSLERHLVHIAISNAVDGVIFFPREDSIHTIPPLLDNQIPFILVDREITGLTSDVIRCDDYTGGYLAGKELCRLGHRRFLYLAGALNVESQFLRERGFMDALAEYGISREEVRIVPALDSEEAMMKDTMLDLLLPIDYTAIFVFKDQTAYSALNSLRRAGYRIPEDISMIGFDYIRQDVPYMAPLTSVACSSSYELAKNTVDMLCRRIENPSLPYEHKVLPVSIHDNGTADYCPTSQINAKNGSV